MQDHPEIIKGLGAITINVIAVITSTQEDLEFSLRIASLGVGIIVGLLTIISICRKMRRDK